MTKTLQNSNKTSNNQYRTIKTYTSPQSTTGINFGEAWCEKFSNTTKTKPLSLHSFKHNRPSSWTDKFRSKHDNKKLTFESKHGPFTWSLTTTVTPTPQSPSFNLPSVSFPDFDNISQISSLDQESELEQEEVKDIESLSRSFPLVSAFPLERTTSLPILNHQQSSFLTKIRERPSLEFNNITLNGRDCEHHVLDQITASKLVLHLPSRLRAIQSWNLLFSIDQHGTSIKTLFRSMINAGTCMIAIRTSNNQIFGGYISHPLQPSPNYYGNGECFLWRENCEHSDYQIEIFNGTGLNHYFIHCEPNFISLGGGNGRYGLWLNMDLESGISYPCPTYNNPQLSDQPDFQCVDLEIWEVSPQIDTS